MAFNIFFEIIDNYYNYDEKEMMLDMWELVKDYNELHGKVRHNVYDWCKEQMDTMEIPEGAFREYYLKELRRSDELDNLIKHIVERCSPECDDF